jgi:hypothetical protein
MKIEIPNFKYALATGNRKETMEIKKGHRIIAHAIRKIIVCDIADDTDFAGVCGIRTYGFSP